MAGTRTSNLNLYKPARTDNVYVVSDINNNWDTVDQFAGETNEALDGIGTGLAIVANGNTHVAISEGQYVYVKNHNNLNTGLYIATTNIAANATLSNSNLSVESRGTLNAVVPTVKDMAPSKLISLSGVGATITIPNNGRHLFVLTGAGVARYAVLLVNAASNGAIQTVEIYKGDNVTITTSDNTVVFRVSGVSSTNITIVDFAMQGNTVNATAISS